MIHAPATLRGLTLAPGGRGEPWRITRESGPDPARALVGRTPQEAARLAPLVFNLCGAAHAAAARAALGLPGDADRYAMARETVRDHALALLHTCPGALGMAPDRDGLALLARPDDTDACAAALVGVAGGDISDDAGKLAAFPVSELDGWLAEAPTPTARLFARLRREIDPAHGRARLPELAAEELAAALLPQAALAASLQPTSPRAAPSAASRAAAAPGEGPGAAAADTAPAPSGADGASFPLRETSALGRVAHRPLFVALLAQEGASLFVRLLARLADCLAALAFLAKGEGAPGRLPRSNGAASGFMAPTGIGIAPAARGLLGHGARVEGGRVASYRILSPSAWNLAPGGLFEQAVATLPPGPDAVRLAPLVVAAINPCVPVALALAPEVAHA